MASRKVRDSPLESDSGSDNDLDYIVGMNSDEDTVDILRFASSYDDEDADDLPMMMVNQPRLPLPPAPQSSRRGGLAPPPRSPSSTSLHSLPPPPSASLAKPPVAAKPSSATSLAKPAPSGVAPATVAYINELFKQVNREDLGHPPLEGENYINQLAGHYRRLNQGLDSHAAEVAARITYNTSYYGVTYPPELTKFIDEMNRYL